MNFSETMNPQAATSQNAQSNIHNLLEAAINRLDDRTQEAVEKLFAAYTTAFSDSITAFSGYYTTNAAPGAFLSIDTTEVYYRLSETVLLHLPTVSVTVSMDGSTVQTYNLGEGSTFSNNVLTIPGTLTITLSRSYNDGVLTSFTGTVNGTAVSGQNCFNGVALRPTFIGEYYEITGGTTAMVSVTENGFYCNTGSGLNERRFYTYNPVMFVLMFTDASTTDKYVLMFGTAGALGRACYVQEGASGSYLVTIPPKM